MTALDIGLAIANLGIARMWPCSALVGPGLYCGATPTSKYRRECGVESHAGEVWLCPVHANMVIAGMTICKLCAARGGITGIARIMRMTEPLRLVTL